MQPSAEPPPGLTRRQFGRLTGALAAVAVTGALRPGESSAQTLQPGELTAEHVEAAERIAGLSFTPEERARMLPRLRSQLLAFGELRADSPPNDLPPAFGFRVLEPVAAQAGDSSPDRFADEDSPDDEARPADDIDLAFLSVRGLSSLVRRRLVSPVELTELCLARLTRFDPELFCTVSLLEETALAEARRAEAEISRGEYRGPLHGIPWGAKDLFAVRGTRTTWGAAPFRDQRIETDAAVVTRLRDAGAILVAKLSLGALAMGDQWFGGRTRNPWNPRSGSSGSSAGPASAVAAGLVPFAIGTETFGSIVSPSAVCGVSGLRPTFGRVSRHGAMALSWTMDKIGPMGRTAGDCALVFSAIHGADPRDPDSVTRTFAWSGDAAAGNARSLRVAYDAECEEALREVLDELSGAGLDPRPVRLPEFSEEAMRLILNVEAAAAFDDLTRDGRDDELTSQAPWSWPNTFRASRLIPAVEYVQAQRLRRRLMEEMNALFADADVLLAPPARGRSLLATNLTGHPSLTLPSGFERGMPRAFSVMSGLFDERAALSFGVLWQERTGWHLRRPPE